MEFDDQDEDMDLDQPSYDNSPMNNSCRVNPSQITKPTTSVDQQLTITSANTFPTYRECLKNHAVGFGGHAVDGCGEFLPAGDDGTLDSLKCAACSCHRNFHRKETETGSFHHHQRLTMGPHHFTAAAYYRSPSGYLHVNEHQARPLALPSTSSKERETEMEEFMLNNGEGSRKRFRTKFTAEQKEKMFVLAETIGWRIQKHDEELVQEFCNENGLKRHVLKVWMHNNKHTLGKRSQTLP